MAIEYFLCYHSYRKKCEKLSDQELGRLFRSLMEYSETGETQELTGRESIAFDFIADDINRAKIAYEEKCKKNSENGKSGGRPKAEKPNGFFENPKKPNTNTNTNQKPNENPNLSIPQTPFGRFWEAYPKKVGKLDAEKAFKKVKVPVDRLLSAIEAQKQSAQWRKNGGQFIPNPATWLNQGRWDDQLDVQGQDGSAEMGDLELAAIKRIMS